MAVENTKSTQITNAELAVATPTASFFTGASTKSKRATLAVAAADDDLSVYRFFRVSSSDVLVSCKVFNDAITGGTDYDFGLYDVADRNAGAVVDANLIGDAVDLSSAVLIGTEIRYEVLNITTVGDRIWELLGLSADPLIDYEFAATGITVGTAAGDIVVEWDYINGP